MAHATIVSLELYIHARMPYTLAIQTIYNNTNDTLQPTRMYTAVVLAYQVIIPAAAGITWNRFHVIRLENLVLLNTTENGCTLRLKLLNMREQWDVPEEVGKGDLRSRSVRRLHQIVMHGIVILVDVRYSELTLMSLAKSDHERAGRLTVQCSKHILARHVSVNKPMQEHVADVPLIT